MGNRGNIRNIGARVNGNDRNVMGNTRHMGKNSNLNQQGRHSQVNNYETDIDISIDDTGGDSIRESSYSSGDNGRSWNNVQDERNYGASNEDLDTGLDIGL